MKWETGRQAVYIWDIIVCSTKMEMRSQWLFLERNLSTPKLLSKPVRDEEDRLIDKFEVFDNFHFKRRLIGIRFFPVPHLMMKLKAAITFAWPWDRKAFRDLASEPYYLSRDEEKLGVRQLQIIATKYWNPEIRSSLNDFKWFLSFSNISS